MVNIYSIVFSRKAKKPDTLNDLSRLLFNPDLGMYQATVFDETSIYDGISKSYNNLWETTPEDIIVLCHDDIKLFQSQEEIKRILTRYLLPSTGFVGLAGACHLAKDPIWWNSRNKNQSRGFVFQGKDDTYMVPNYFGPHGQVVCLDGCFLATTVKVLNDIGTEKPEYLSANWDFYDIHLTFTAFLKGYNNYTVPIIARHISNGEMREGWYAAKQEFARHHTSYLPAILPMDKTHGFIV